MSDMKKRLCIVPVCKGQRFELVHKFPMDNQRAEDWKSILGAPELQQLSLDTIRKRYFVCSRHFKTHDYKNVESRSLNKTAYPSINLRKLDDPEGLDRVIPPFQSQNKIEEAHFLDRNSNANESPKLDIVNYIYEEQLDQPDALKFGTGNSNIYCLDVDDSMMVKKIDVHQPENNQIILQKVVLSKKIPEKRSANGEMSAMSPAKIFKYKNSQSQAELQKSQVKLSPPLKLEKITMIQTAKIKSVPPPASPTTDLIQETDDAPRSKLNKIIGQTSGKPLNIVNQISSSTQTDVVEEPETPLPPEMEAIQQPASNTTKVLALFECTPENLSKLQNRLLRNDVNIFNFNEDLLNEGDAKQGEEKTDEAMSENDAYLKIKNHETDQSINVNYFWLRDHCRCKSCYNFDTNQRRISILDIPSDVKPESWEIVGNDLSVNWKDGHVSTYAIDFIFSSQLEVVKEVAELDKNKKILWNRELITSTEEYARVNLNNLLCDDDFVKQIITSLVKYGVAFIEKVPANQQSTEIAIKRIFPIHKTLFGEMWTFSDTSSDHSDTAYTKDFLGLHSDNSYFNDPSGLQILHCIQFNGTGGESLLADGFQAVENLREKDSAAFDRLCEYQIPAEYIEEGKHHTHCAPIIKKHDISGHLEQIRFNMYDRSVLKTLPSDQIGLFYSDYRKLAQEINTKENEWCFKLNPGTVMIFDNWRVLHGRMKYTGKRVMTGCYVSRTEFLSAARSLNIIE